jgi:hypothetical protein
MKPINLAITSKFSLVGSIHPGYEKVQNHFTQLFKDGQEKKS